MQQVLAAKFFASLPKPEVGNMSRVAKIPVVLGKGVGEGRTGTGRAPVTPWGQLTKGYRTRNNKRTDNMIVSRRYRK